MNNLCTDKLFECCTAKFKMNSISFVSQMLKENSNSKLKYFNSGWNKLKYFDFFLERNVITPGNISVDILKLFHDRFEKNPSNRENLFFCVRNPTSYY